MQDEVQANQRQPKICFCHSCGLRYKLPQHEIWDFLNYSFFIPLNSFHWKEMQVTSCVWMPLEWLLRLSMHQHKFPFRDLGYGEGLNVKVKSLPKPEGNWIRIINKKNCSWDPLASAGKDIHQVVYQNSLKVDNGGTGVAAFEGAKTGAKIGPGSIFS